MLRFSRPPEFCSLCEVSLKLSGIYPVLMPLTVCVHVCVCVYLCVCVCAGGKARSREGKRETDTWHGGNVNTALTQN